MAARPLECGICKIFRNIFEISICHFISGNMTYISRAEIISKKPNRTMNYLEFLEIIFMLCKFKTVFLRATFYDTHLWCFSTCFLQFTEIRWLINTARTQNSDDIYTIMHFRQAQENRCIVWAFSNAHGLVLALSTNIPTPSLSHASYIRPRSFSLTLTALT